MASSVKCLSTQLRTDKLNTVRVTLVGAPSTSSDFAGDYSANADSTVTVVPVTLNRHKYKTVHVTAKESAETAMTVIETLVEAAQQLAQDVLVDIFGCITASEVKTVQEALNNRSKKRYKFLSLTEFYTQNFN
jgi:hypothetical protein